MKTVDILTAAKALIAEDASAMEGFNQHGRTLMRVYRKADGNSTMKRSEATCFCSIGAVLGALNLDAENGGTGLFSEGDSVHAPNGPTASKSQRKSFMKAMEYLAAAVRFVRSGLYERPWSATKQVYEFNDLAHKSAKFKHEDVMRAFDLAIKNAKRRHIFGSKKAVAL